jgi:hypothetical protein
MKITVAAGGERSKDEDIEYDFRVVDRIKIKHRLSLIVDPLF